MPTPHRARECVRSVKSSLEISKIIAQSVGCSQIAREAVLSDFAIALQHSGQYEMIIVIKVVDSMSVEV